MIRIGLEQGQNWRDVVRWNAIENPNLIEVGQVLRVVPPQADAAALASQGVAPTKVESKPLDGKPAAAAPAAVGAAAPAAVVAPPPAAQTDDEPAWAWPSAGTVLAGFEEGRQKGLAISGKAGDPVLAAADGRVVYVGAGLRGYGILIILKHNNTYLTAYAHNQTLLIKEDQSVRKGQKIAEMGSSDADRVKLHFEVRRQGKPVDPAKYLPPK
jgi:lipoprotein NlpD